MEPIGWGVGALAGGWCYFQHRDLEAHGIHIQFEDTNGRLVAQRILIDGGVTTDLLRAVPLGLLEQIANGDIGSTIRERASEAKKKKNRLPRSPDPGDLDYLQPDDVDRSRLRLTPPPRGGRYPDEFFEQVAVAWSVASANLVAPAKAIAEESGAATTTVHGWVKEARRRGLLAPGRKARFG